MGSWTGGGTEHVDRGGEPLTPWHLQREQYGIGLKERPAFNQSEVGFVGDLLALFGKSC